MHPLFYVLKTLLSFLQSNVCIKDSVLCWKNSKNIIFFIDMEIASPFNVFEKKKNHMWDALALENEKTNCSGLSWIVSIMVNGFSKCQSSCFIDLASLRAEQTHLDGILLTAKAVPCIHKPNQEKMWISFCPFVMHILCYTSASNLWHIIPWAILLHLNYHQCHCLF